MSRIERYKIMSMSLKDLCEKIELPEAVISNVILLEQSLELDQLDEVNLLMDSGNWDTGLEILRTRLGEDKEGFKILTVMLYAALKTKMTYDRMGIEESVFLDTMKCFTRFVNEYRESYGDYGFDRDFWVPRQLSCLLFRLGTLEFEMKMIDNDGVLDIHIPSDADLSREKCDESYEMAKQFFLHYFPEFQYINICCSSWLLSPELKEVLPVESKIIQFQNQFKITEVYPDNQEYLIWIFKSKDIPFEKLPENTSLQKNVKRYLLEGKHIGSADGIL